MTKAQAVPGIRSVRVLALAAALAGLVALLGAQPAAAAKVKLGGGTTTLALDRALAGGLNGAGIKAAPVRPAKAGSAGLAFPITGGSLDPRTARGSIRHSGGIALSKGATRVRLTRFRVHVGARRGTLTALVGGQRAAILGLSLRRAKLSRKGFTTTVKGVQAAFTGGAAKAINSAFGARLLRAGTRAGRVTVKARAAEAELARGSTTLAPDAGALAALQSEGISPSPIAPATIGSDGLAFPITGGKLNLSTLAGRVTHSGGLALTKGSTRVELTAFTINVDSAPDLVASLGSARPSILDLDVSGLKRSVSGRTLSISGVKATLTQGAADALNQAFSTNKFQKGLLLGTTTTRATAR